MSWNSVCDTIEAHRSAAGCRYASGALDLACPTLVTKWDRPEPMRRGCAKPGSRCAFSPSASGSLCQTVLRGHSRARV